MVTALSLAAIFLVAVDGQIFPSILTRLGGTSVQEGLLLGALFALYPLSSVLAGTVADRTGKRAVVAAGMLFVALPFASSAVFTDIRARTLAVLLFGLGGGVIESQISALLSDLNPRRERAVMNLSQTLFSAGAAGGPFLITLVAWLSRTMSLSPLLWAVAAANFLLAVSFILAPLFSPAPAGQPGAPGPRPRASRAGSSRAGAAVPPTAKQPPRAARQAKAAAEQPPAAPAHLLGGGPLLWLLAAGVFLYVAAEMGTAGWLAKFGETELGLSPRLAPLCLTLFWGGLGISRGLIGLGKAHWSDRAVLLGSLSLTLAGQVLVFTLASPILALIAIAVTGFGMGAVWPTLVAIAAVRFRRSSGTAVGIVVAAGALAIPIVQFLVGQLSGPGRLSLRHTLLSLSVATVLNLALMLLVFRRSGPGSRR